MSDNTNNDDEFIGYEYREVTVKQALAPVYIDGYANFGWTLEGTESPLQEARTTVLKLKRDRKIRNKAELTRLQRQFEAGVSEIETLERSKTLGASTVAYILGVIGCGFMAGSVFAVEASLISLTVILAIPGFILWIIPYFVFRKMAKNKSEEVTPFIDNKYDEIYEICEKANRLLDK